MFCLAKFKFRLQSYLGVKEKLEEQKKLEYGKALHKLDLEKQEKARLVGEKQESINSFRDSVNRKISPSELQMHNYYLSHLKKKMVVQDEKIAKTEIQVEKRKQEAIEAMKERKILDKLKENDFVEYTKSEQLKEAKMLDEIVSYKYNQREDD